MSVRTTIKHAADHLNPDAFPLLQLASATYRLVEINVARDIHQELTQLIYIMDNQSAQSSDPVPPEATC